MGSTGRVGSVRLRRHTPRGRAERVPAGGRVGCLPPGAAPQSPAGPLSTPGAAPAPRSWWAARCHIPRSLVCPLPCSSPPSWLPVLQVLLRAPRGCPSTPVSGRPAWPGPTECAGCRSGYWLPCSLLLPRPNSQGRHSGLPAPLVRQVAGQPRTAPAGFRREEGSVDRGGRGCGAPWEAAPRRGTVKAEGATGPEMALQVSRGPETAFGQSNACPHQLRDVIA